MGSLKQIYVSLDNLKIDEIFKKNEDQKMEFEAKKRASPISR